MAATGGTGRRRALRATFWLLALSAGWSVPWLAGAQPTDKTDVFQYDAGGRRDPFIPLVRDGRLIGGGRSAQQLGEPSLHGILWDAGGHSIALIDDAEVRVGDTIAGYEVAEIRRDGVVLKSGEKSLVLTIAFEAGEPGATTGGMRP